MPSDHPYYGVTAYPLSKTKPELWHLGINKEERDQLLNWASLYVWTLYLFSWRTRSHSSL
ncbi:hypothetical protein AAAC51_16395 [Priestia megaterium]